jgi:hypothetical protein
MTSMNSAWQRKWHASGIEHAKQPATARRAKIHNVRVDGHSGTVADGSKALQILEDEERKFGPKPQPLVPFC